MTDVYSKSPLVWFSFLLSLSTHDDLWIRWPSSILQDVRPLHFLFFCFSRVHSLSLMLSCGHWCPCLCCQDPWHLLLCCWLTNQGLPLLITQRPSFILSFCPASYYPPFSSNTQITSSLVQLHCGMINIVMLGFQNEYWWDHLSCFSLQFFPPVPKHIHTSSWDSSGIVHIFTCIPGWLKAKRSKPIIHGLHQKIFLKNVGFCTFTWLTHGNTGRSYYIVDVDITAPL